MVNYRLIAYFLLVSSFAQGESEAAKKKIVAEFHEKAKRALNAKSYSEAIAAAETMRGIRLKKDQKHLNLAKQIIDKAKTARKEEFDSFIVEAKEQFDRGNYQASRDLCQEMLKKDPHYGVAKDCVSQSQSKIEIKSKKRK